MVTLFKDMQDKEEHFDLVKRKSQNENDDHGDLNHTSTHDLVDSRSISWEDQGCLCSFVPKRYMVTFLAMFGFFNAYALRVNLSVAMVAMVTNVTKFGHGLETEVCAVIVIPKVCT